MIHQIKHVVWQSESPNTPAPSAGSACSWAPQIPAGVADGWCQSACGPADWLRLLRRA